MSRQAARRVAMVAAVWDLLALAAILAIGTYGTLHHATGFYDDGPTPERTLVSLWILWGLIPAFILTAGATFAILESSDERE